MTPRKTIRDVPASVRQRLLNLAREQRVRFEGMLQRYAIERFLYRLSASDEVDRFTLKGAALLRMWTGQELRPTRDIDFLARGARDEAAIRAALRAVCGIPCREDGVVFDPATISITSIRIEQPDGGLRVRIRGGLGRVRLAVPVDIGFGDVITLGRREEDYPTLLDLPAPRLWTYPRETMIAEKFHAMASLGDRNSRVKDLWDVACLARRFAFDGESLRHRHRRDVPPLRDVAHRRAADGAAGRLLRRPRGPRARATLARDAAADRHRHRRAGPPRGSRRGAAPLPGAGLRQPDRGEPVHAGVARRWAVAAGEFRFGQEAQAVSEAAGRVNELDPRQHRRYPAYKPSGIEWLDGIPANWETKRLRFIVETGSTKREVADLDPETEVSFVPMEAVRGIWWHRFRFGETARRSCRGLHVLPQRGCHCRQDHPVFRERQGRAGHRLVQRCRLWNDRATCPSSLIPRGSSLSSLPDLQRPLSSDRYGFDVRGRWPEAYLG